MERRLFLLTGLLILVLYVEQSEAMAHASTGSASVDRQNRKTAALIAAVKRVSQVKCPFYLSPCSLTAATARRLEMANESCANAFRYLHEMGSDEVGTCASVINGRCERHGGLCPECVGTYLSRDGRIRHKLTLAECVERMQPIP